MWTRFMDMHSGGGQKEKFSHCYIEAPQAEAEIIFYSRFGHNPYRVTCTCCGEDYSIDEEKDLEQATAFERNCEWSTKDKKYIERVDQKNLEIRQSCNTPQDDYWGLYIPLDEYLKKDSVMVIYAKDIKQNERIGKLPEQGYVWVD